MQKIEACVDQLLRHHLPTAELQALDAAHHIHPFTTQDDLAAKGARIITRASGVTLTDSEGAEILTIDSHTYATTTAAFSPDGNQIVTVTDPGALFVLPSKSW